MSSLIISLIPEHKLYCEPFFGGGAVFFAKPQSEMEVINDLNDWVITFYKVIKTDFGILKMLIDQTVSSRSIHREAAFILKNSKNFNDIKVAWAFWVQTNMSFSSGIFGGYGYGLDSRVIKAINNKKTAFNKSLTKRIENTDIENNDAIKVIKSRDSSDAFFYIDPPYFNSDCGQYKGYTEKDFIDLLNCLEKIKGKFLLSSYPSDILNSYIERNNFHVYQKESPISVTYLTKKTKTEQLTGNYNFNALMASKPVAVKKQNTHLLLEKKSGKLTPLVSIKWAK